MLSVVKLEPNSEGTAHSPPKEQWGVFLKENVCGSKVMNRSL